MIRSQSLVLALVWGCLVSCQPSPKETTVQLVQKHLETYSDSLDVALQDLLHAVQQHRPSAELQHKFESARQHYKYLEPFTELYFPGFSDAVNGPAIDEAEAYEGKVIEASGFQVVEEYLYPQTDTASYEDLIRETGILASITNRLKQLVAGNELTDAHIFQAMRLGLIRVSSLGISGFDSPIAKASLPEAMATLQGIEKVLMLYRDVNGKKGDAQKIRRDFKQAYDHLSGNQDFNTFDRAAFISNDIRSLSESISQYQQDVGIPNRNFPAAIDLNKASILDTNAFHLEYFVNPANSVSKPEIASLGKLLFFDPVLSGSNQRACASCHQPSRAFTDGRSRSLAFEANGDLKRNAPTVINSVYQRMQFYDSRVMFQEDQVSEVVSNPQEMHGQIDEAVLKIKKSKAYRELFDQAFGGTNGQSITDRHVQRAIAQYVRSLSSMNAGFDRYMRGDQSAMSAEALAGLNIFMGKGKCGTCHFMPLFNGTLPPFYTKSESEVLGVPNAPDTINATIDPDLGKYLIYGGDLNRHAFKTPTVRNAALTAPYMHNGVYKTLEEVIDFYNRGGGEGIGVHLPNQTLPPDRLDLSEAEKKSLIAFIHALTDTSGLSAAPSQLPAFDDPLLRNRKTGGTY